VSESLRIARREIASAEHRAERLQDDLAAEIRKHDWPEREMYLAAVRLRNLRASLWTATEALDHVALDDRYGREDDDR
jgi:hypothetical protein